MDALTIPLAVVFTVAWTLFCLRLYFVGKEKARENEHCLHDKYLANQLVADVCCLCMDEWGRGLAIPVECSKTGLTRAAGMK
jgi:hypothetical protein